MLCTLIMLLLLLRPSALRSCNTTLRLVHLTSLWTGRNALLVLCISCSQQQKCRVVPRASEPLQSNGQCTAARRHNHTQQASGALAEASCKLHQCLDLEEISANSFKALQCGTMPSGRSEVLTLCKCSHCARASLTFLQMLGHCDKHVHRYTQDNLCSFPTLAGRRAFDQCMRSQSCDLPASLKRLKRFNETVILQAWCQGLAWRLI